jgi:hypothetical protein
MSQDYIRIAKTPDVEQALADLRARYSLLTEAEIIRLALSEIRNKEVEAKMEQEQKIREKFNNAIEEGGKVGDKILNKLLAKKGLKRENMTEQEIYDTFLDTHKHNA